MLVASGRNEEIVPVLNMEQLRSVIIKHNMGVILQPVTKNCVRAERFIIKYVSTYCFDILEASEQQYSFREHMCRLRGGGGGSACVFGSAMQGLWENYELSSYVTHAHTHSGNEDEEYVEATVSSSMLREKMHLCPISCGAHLLPFICSCFSAHATQ